MVAEATPTALMLADLAETCGKNERVEEGLDLVTKGLTTAEKTGQRVAEAELHRIRGELLLIKDSGNVAEAEHCLARRSTLPAGRAPGYSNSARRQPRPPATRYQST